jgi:hypothetical protein
MKKTILRELSTRDLTMRFTDITLDQYTALMGNDVRRYNKLYSQMDAVAQELKSRPGDERKALIALYGHPNPQVRLAAAKRTLALNYAGARQVIEEIAGSRQYPIAGHAGMTLFALDDGILKPT